MSLKLDAPNTIEPPLSVWQVGYGPEHPKPLGSISKFISRVRAEFTAPCTGSVVRNITLSLEVPGVVTSLSETSFDRLWPGESVTVTWRWAAPVRDQLSPYSLSLATRVKFTQANHSYTESDKREVDIRSPSPPIKDAYISDLPLCYEVNGIGPIKLNTWNGSIGPNDDERGLIKLDGVTYNKGLGTCSPSVAGFYLGGNCASFTSKIGIDDRDVSEDAVLFSVIGDGDILYESDTMDGSSVSSFSVDISDVEQLKLIVENADDSQNHVLADWANAYLTTHSGYKNQQSLSL